MRRQAEIERGGADQQDVVESILAELKQFWQEYGRVVIVAAVVLVAIMLGYRAYRGRLDRDEMSTWQELSRLERMAFAAASPAKDAQERYGAIIKSYQQILDSRWKTDATPWVMLKLADAQYKAGLMPGAVSTYYRLLDEYPDSVAAPMARPALAVALEDMGRYVEAAKLYEELARTEGGSSGYLLDAARSLELAGRTALAEQHYRELLRASSEQSPYVAEMAAFRLRQLEKGNPLTLPPAPPPEVPQKEQGAGAEPEAGKQPAEPNADLGEHPRPPQPVPPGE